MDSGIDVTNTLAKRFFIARGFWDVSRNSFLNLFRFFNNARYRFLNRYRWWFFHYLLILARNKRYHTHTRCLLNQSKSIFFLFKVDPFSWHFFSFLNVFSSSRFNFCFWTNKNIRFHSKIIKYSNEKKRSQHFI